MTTRQKRASTTDSAVNTGNFASTDPVKKKKPSRGSKIERGDGSDMCIGPPSTSKISLSSLETNFGTKNEEKTEDQLITPRTMSAKFAKMFTRKSSSGTDLLLSGEKKKKKKPRKGQGEEVERSIKFEENLPPEKEEEKNSDNEKEETNENNEEQKKSFKKRRASTHTVSSVKKEKKDQKRTASQTALNLKLVTEDVIRKKESIGTQIKGELQNLLSPRRSSSTQLPTTTPGSPQAEPTTPPGSAEKPKEEPEKKKEDPAEEKRKLKEKAKKKKEQKEKLISELIETEKKYVAYLKVLNDSFVTPIKNSFDQTNEIVTREEYETIFQNIDEIYAFHNEFVTKIDEIQLQSISKDRKRDSTSGEGEESSADISGKPPKSPKQPKSPKTMKDSITKKDERKFKKNKKKFHKMLIPVFLDFLQDENLLKAYKIYTAHYSESQSFTHEKLKSLKFASFISSKTAAMSLDLASHLIMPIQRFPRYILLINAILANTPDPHSTREQLKSALATATSFSEKLNSFTKTHAEKTALFSKFSEEDCNQLSVIMYNDEELIYQGPVELYSNAPSSSLSSSKKPKYLIIIFTNHIIIATSTSKKSDKINSYQLLCCIDIYSSTYSYNNLNISDENPIPFVEIYDLQRIKDFPYFRKKIWKFIGSDSEFITHLQKIYSTNKSVRMLSQRADRTQMEVQNIIYNSSYWNDLLSLSKKTSYTEAEVLVKEGQPIDSIFFVRSGSVDIYRNIDGEDVYLKSLYEREIFGEVGLFQNKFSATATIVVKENSQISSISYKKLERIFDENEEISWRFYYLLCVVIGSRIIRTDWLVSDGELSKTKPKPQKSKSPVSDPFLKAGKSESISHSGSTSSVSALSGNTVETPAPPNSNSTLLTLAQQQQETVDEVDYITTFRCNIKKKKPTTDSEKCILRIADDGITIKIKPPKSLKMLGKQLKEYKIDYSSITSRPESPISFHISLSYKKEDKTQTDWLVFDSAEELKSVLDLLEAKISISKLEFELINKEGNRLNIPGEQKIFDSVVFTQGTISDVFQVISGHCNVQITNQQGKLLNVATLSEGEIFGELSFVIGTVTSAQVAANPGTVLVSCSRENLLNLGAKSRSVFYKAIAKTLCARFVKQQMTINNSNNK